MIRRLKTASLLIAPLMLAAFLPSAQETGETWHGLVIAPEHRCSPYDKKRDYP